MNGPQYFDNEIVKVQNLQFLTDSTSDNIIQNFLTFTNQTGGIVDGLNLSSGVGLTLNISAGIAYDNSGERMVAYSGVSIIVLPGSNYVWASMLESDFNPNPASDYNSFPAYGQTLININPINGSGISTSSFNTIVIGQIPGPNSIPLGLVTTDVNNTFITSIDQSSASRQGLKLLGILDVQSTTIDGHIITSGSINSNQFTYPLTYDFAISGNNINTIVSGTSNIASASIPLASVSTKTLNVTNISGLSPINIQSPLILASGAGSINTINQSLSINPSGQNTYIGNAYNSPSPGTLFVNNISAWGTAPFQNTSNLTILGYVTTINAGNQLSMQGSQSFYMNTSSGVGTFGTLEANGIKIWANPYNVFAPDCYIYMGGNTGSQINMTAESVNIGVGGGGIPAASQVNIAPGGVNISSFGLGNTGISLSAVNVNITSGTTNIATLNTGQTFENLIENSTFAHSNVYTVNSPLVWNIYSGASSAVYTYLENSSNDPLVYVTEADNYMRVRVSGLTSNGVFLSIPITDAENTLSYGVSYFVRASGVAGASIANLKTSSLISQSPDLSIGPFFTSTTISTTNPYVNTPFSIVGNSWAQSTQNIGPISGQTKYYLIIKLYNSSGTGNYDLYITNVRMTKGKGIVRTENNNRGAWNINQFSGITTTNGGNVTAPLSGVSQTIVSKGQFAMINMNALHMFNITSNPKDDPLASIRLFIDGVQQASATSFRGQDGFAGGTQSVETRSIACSWAGYLAPGVHGISGVGNVQLLPGFTSVSNSCTVTSGTMSILLV